MPGFEDVAKELRATAGLSGTAGPRGQALVAAALIKSLVGIEADAKRLAPVDTGFLRNSISREVTADTVRGAGTEFGGQVGPSASYGAYVEYGTSRMGPEPYMGPAFDRHAPGFVAAIEQIPGRIFKP